MKGSGGTEGGTGLFFIGLCLAIGSTYLFFDSVRVTTGAGFGWISGLYARNMSGGFQTTSMGIIFVPFFLGVFLLFYDASKRWAWWVMWGGVGIIAVEILSRIHFYMNVKTTHFMLMVVGLAAGLALMAKSYKSMK